MDPIAERVYGIYTPERVQAMSAATRDKHRRHSERMAEKYKRSALSQRVAFPEPPYWWNETWTLSSLT